MDAELYSSEQRRTLLSFVVASRIEQAGQTLRAIAASGPNGFSAQRLSDLIKGTSLTDDKARSLLAQLEDVLHGLQPRFGAGPLVSYYGQLFPTATSIVSVPAYWTESLLRERARSPEEILLQAEAFFALLANRRRAALGHYEEAALTTLVDNLLVLGGLPRRGGIEALQMVARFAGLWPCYRQVIARIETALRFAPTGFRAWRIVSSLVRNQREEASKRKNPALIPEPVLEWVEEQFQPAARAKHWTLNPARSLDIEAAATMPDDCEWANAYLAGEAVRPDATPRQRGYAALALWEHTADVATQQKILDSLDDPASPPSSQLDWIRRNVQHLVDVAPADAATLPEGPEVALVTGVARSHLLGKYADFAQYLFLHGVLSNHGVARRLALDTLRTAGLGKSAAGALYDLVKMPRVPPFLLERCALAAGLLAHKETDAVRTVRQILNPPSRDLESLGAIEAAAWAVGDIWSSDTGTDPQAWASQLLRDHVRSYGASEDWNERRIACASIYSLAMLGDRDSAKLLVSIEQAGGSDDVVKLAAWANTRYKRNPPHRLIELPLTAR